MDASEVARPASPPSLHPRALVRTLGDLVFPPLCQLCGERTSDVLCQTCRERVRFLQPPWCERCGRPFPPLGRGGPLCAECAAGRNRFDCLRSVGYYAESLREAILALKYNRKHRIARPLGTWMAECAERMLAECDLPRPGLLVPVPLHPSRRRRRGYNQSLLLCREMAHALGPMPLEELLTRPRPSQPQTGLSRNARLANIRGAFALRPGAVLVDRVALLVDDVMTTGATLNECARVLQRAGCRLVLCVTAARQVDL